MLKISARRAWELSESEGGIFGNGRKRVARKRREEVAPDDPGRAHAKRAVRPIGQRVSVARRAKRRWGGAESTRHGIVPDAFSLTTRVA